MTVRITEKENYLRLLHGDRLYWVPLYSAAPVPGDRRACASAVLSPPFINRLRADGGAWDVWGGDCPPPAPGRYPLEDITRWRDAVKAPSLRDIDFDRQVREGLTALCARGFDREHSCLEVRFHPGYFRTLAGLMGPENALLAMAEEPGEVFAMFSYMCDWFTGVEARLIDRASPDVYALSEDFTGCAEARVTAKMYRELILPFHAREAAFAREREIPLLMHWPGPAAEFTDEWVSVGVSAWAAGRGGGDLDEVKARCGGRLAVMGGWDARGRLLESGCTDEEIRRSVRETMDRYAPGGGFAWYGGFPDDGGEMRRRNAVLFDEVRSCGDAFYGYGGDIHYWFDG